MSILSFQLFCTDAITNSTDLFEQLDRAIKAKNQTLIESLFLQPAQKKLSQDNRNSLLERSLFFHSNEEKEMALFLLGKQEILKVNLLGIHDILRLSILRERPDVTNFVLFQISNAQLRPEISVIEACKRSAEEKKNAKLIKVFESYFNPNPQSTSAEASVVTIEFPYSSVCSSAGMTIVVPGKTQVLKFEDLCNENVFAGNGIIPAQENVRQVEEIEANTSYFSYILTFIGNNISRYLF